MLPAKRGNSFNAFSFNPLERIRVAGEQIIAAE
jgi:hypothetical protein